MNSQWRLLIKLGLVLSLNSCDTQVSSSIVVNNPEVQQKVITLPSFSGKTYFIAVDGDDRASGSLESPFQSINQVIPKLQAGDGVIIRGGRYKEPIDASNLNGSRDKPISFVAYPGEKVIFDGSIEIKQAWEKDSKGIFSTQIDEEVTQLFINNEMCITARWPNASLADDSVFDMKSTWRHQGVESTFGEMFDARPKALKAGINEQTLAETGIDFTGAVAVLNINAWMSYAQKVAKHEAGSNSFTYDTVSMQGNLNMLKNEKFFAHKKKLGHYYLEGLMALDAEQEWYFTPQDKRLYLKPKAGQKPEDLIIRAKVQDYNLRLKKSSHVNFKGIQFFATTLKFDDCTKMLVDDCHFLYPSFNKFVLGDFSKNKYTMIENQMSDDMAATHNKIVNCTFEYADGPAIKMTGYENLIENNLFHHIDFTCIGGGDGGTIEMGRGRKSSFRYNTVHTAGNSEGYRSGPGDLVEYNYFHNMSLLQHDGSAINCGVAAIKDSKVNHNWIHGLRSKAAIRFDTSSMFTAFVNWGEGGTVNHNVVWDSAGLKLKGDHHKVYNNLSFDAFAAGKTDIALPCAPLMGGYNRYSEVKNNIAGAINGHFAVSRGIPLFCKSENNLETDPRTVLRDPSNLDFRPDKKILGIGPYEAELENYWIPGYQSAKASMPIPAQNAKNVKSNADLIWRPARGSQTFEIYFSEDKSLVEKADPAALRAKQSNNILKQGNIDSQKTYFWRVDSYVDGKKIEGDLWTFGGLEEVHYYDYNYPKKPIPMNAEIKLPKTIENLAFNEKSEQILLDIYQRFWWSENFQWFKTLKEAEIKLKPGERGFSTIQKRLAEFKLIEHEFLLTEACKKLELKQIELLQEALNSEVLIMEDKKPLLSGIK